jgi:uncharacterized membrane protein YqjE
MGDIILSLNNLIRNKQFWLALVGLALIVVKAFWPTFPVSEEAITTVVLTIVATVFGISFAASLVAMARYRNLKSKGTTVTFLDGLMMIIGNKAFWVGVVGVAMIVIRAYWVDFPISQEAIVTVVLTVVGVIFSITFTNVASFITEMYSTMNVKKRNF